MRVVLSTGGSGGHVFPALYTAHELQKLGHEVIFVGALGTFAEKIRNKGFQVFTFESKGLSFSSIPKLTASLVGNFKATRRSLEILKDIKPQVVCGFGGYGAFAVVLAAVVLKIPAMIHEQNVVPGKANRALSKLVQKVALNFKEGEKYFGKKSVVTGCPCHRSAIVDSRDSLRKSFGLKENVFTILILGGSQGSRRINQEFLKTVELLEGQLEFQCIHLSGASDYPWLKEKYPTLKVEACVFEFFDEMEKAYSAADLVISRAGAVTVCEIGHFRLPSIFIPYPYVGGHQKENAKVLLQTGIARIIDEADLTASLLKTAIEDSVQRKNSGTEKREELQNIFFLDAAERLAKEIISLKT